jgi:hypothetical protein
MHQTHAGSRPLRDAVKEALGEVQIMPLLQGQVEISNALGLHLWSANDFT